MFALIMLVLGCVQELEITYYGDGCTDWSFEEGVEPVVVVEKVGDDILMIRKGVAQQCDASFQPEIVAQRSLIQVFEYWEVPEDADDCESCFFPTVQLQSPGKGDYELQWFEGDSSVTPVGFIEVTVE